MSTKSHCKVCGRRLRDAFFCRQCGEAFCSGHCLKKHSHQPGADQTTDEKTKKERPNRRYDIDSGFASFFSSICLAEICKTV